MRQREAARDLARQGRVAGTRRADDGDALEIQRQLKSWYSSDTHAH